MTKVDVSPTVHAERGALAAELEGLTDEQWATPSMCGGWTVRDVLAHMTSVATLSAGKFFVGLISSGFSFNRLQDKRNDAIRGATPADTLSAFKAVQKSTIHPPGRNDTWLGEVIVHSSDIRRPLGMAHTFPSTLWSRSPTSTRART